MSEEESIPYLIMIHNNYAYVNVKPAGPLRLTQGIRMKKEFVRIPTLTAALPMYVLETRIIENYFTQSELFSMLQPLADFFGEWLKKIGPI